MASKIEFGYIWQNHESYKKAFVSQLEEEAEAQLQDDMEAVEEEKVEERKERFEYEVEMEMDENTEVPF